MTHRSQLPGIPSVPKLGEKRERFDSAVKEALESIMGRRRGPKVSTLPSTATTAEIIDKINELIEVLQG